jgi:hypothetical protein
VLACTLNGLSSIGFKNEPSEDENEEQVKSKISIEKSSERFHQEIERLFD